MDKQVMPLSHLPINKKAKIVSIQGGYGFQRKLGVMGIREKQKIKIVSRQPFHGPLTIEVRGSQMTLGRGMAQKIMVEVVQ
ncbi:MAG: ferrous iron transport protein A [Thermoplasmatales archaeon]|nr:ferrous iron transport protein A [Thermoplasmatales archaeon]